MNHNLAYQDDPREELIDGKIIAMSPRPSYNHNKAASNVYRRFADYLEKRKCEAIADGTDLYLNETNRFIPDMMVVCDPDKIKWDGVHGAPDLVAEVLSPATRRRDKKEKMQAYGFAGVREYWLVDPSSESVEVYLNEGGSFRLDNVYIHCPACELERMSAAERAAVPACVRCLLFDDFEISVADIFKGLLAIG